VAVNGSQSYAPYGEVFDASGAMSSPFAFTGEPLDGNGLQYHRARYMNPALGGFLSLDPFEGVYSRPMSLNGYSWVEGDVVNAVDPTGMCIEKEFCYRHMPPHVQCMCFDMCTPPATEAELQRFGCKSNTIPALDDDSIKDATVHIVTPDPTSGLCNTSSGNIAGLGTITSNGIITHDHWIDYPGSWNVSYLENEGNAATNATEAEMKLKTWPCIVVTGKSGFAHLSGEKLIIDSTGANGSILIHDKQVDVHGNPVTLSTLGRSVPVKKGWIAQNAERIRVAKKDGDNRNANVYDHSSIGLFHLNVSNPARIIRSGDRDTYETDEIYWALYNDRPSEGDSGGGVFNDEGFLVGVTFAIQGHNDSFLATRFKHVFTPS